MNFRTEINIKNSSLQIEHDQNIFTIGSCFAENIGNKFQHFLFNITKNPFGVLYNPISILNSLTLLKNERSFSEDDLFYDQSEYHSFYHHSNFSSENKSNCLENINKSLSESSKSLKKTDLIIITYGTSFVYELIDKKIIVSNCHKIPAKEFNRFRLTISQLNDTISKTIQLLHSINPKMKIIFTVSPVRHWKDGAVDNQLSKALLLVSVHETIKNFNNIEYYPSYEIMMDDLRDYRFYEADLLHPNSQAVEYIWNKFAETYFTESCKNVMMKTGKLSAAKNHRVRNKNSEKYINFAASNLKLIKELQTNQPHLKLKEFEKYFNQ